MLQIDTEPLMKPIETIAHDQAGLPRISDRIAVMDRGRILQIGRPMDVYLRSASVDVATFIGTSNHFTGHIVNGILVAGGGPLGRKSSQP